MSPSDAGPLRLLVVSDEMEVGGSQRQIVRLLLGLKQRGVEVALLYFRTPSFLLDEVVAAGIPVRRIDKRGAIDPLFLLRLWRFLRRGRFELAHCFSITAEIWVRALLPLLPGLRLVSSIRGLGLDGPGWHWRAKRWIIRGSAAVISNSQAGAELVAERCAVPRSAIEVVYNAVALPDSQAALQRGAMRETLAAQGVVLLFVGRLVPVKNLPLLIEALQRIPPAQRPCCWLAGDGPERAGLLAQIARAGLGDSVSLLGERDDVDALIGAADLLVLPSQEEGLSNVILEAMAQGLAVLATRVGGTPELIEHGVSGWLVEAGDVQALSEAIIRLAADPAQRSRLGEAARRRVAQRFSSQAMVEATLAVYRNCLVP